MNSWLERHEQRAIAPDDVTAEEVHAIDRDRDPRPAVKIRRLQSYIDREIPNNASLAVQMILTGGLRETIVYASHHLPVTAITHDIPTIEEVFIVYKSTLNLS